MFPAVGKRNMGSVGGLIVVGGRESRPQGEGDQRQVILKSTRSELDEVQAVKTEIGRVRTGG
jgi:hypothetical protein